MQSLLFIAVQTHMCCNRVQNKHNPSHLISQKTTKVLYKLFDSTKADQIVPLCIEDWYLIYNTSASTSTS